MSRYVLDAWAWIEYFEGSSKGAQVKDVIFDTGNEIYTHCVSVAEIVSKGERSGKDTNEIWRAITNNSTVIEFNTEESREVGITHARTKSKNRNFSLADAFVLISARKLRAKVLTGDLDFKNIPDVVLL